MAGGIKNEEEKKEEEEKLELWTSEANDQLVRERGKCLEKDHHVQTMFKVLEQCQKRVLGKSYTMETCHQEMKDLIMAVDHCVGDKAFRLLK